MNHFLTRCTRGQVISTGLVLTSLLACTAEPDPSPTPSPTPTATPVPTPFPTVMCEWDDSPRLTEVEPWWYDAVFYEIFVRSFQDSDGDGVGDLRGILSRLDHLNDGDPLTHDDLGVTGIWLMPIFTSPSVHGYDITDYLTIDPEYGTQADFEALLDAAHARGIRIILDLPFNHTSTQHPWFVDSASSETSAKRSWYVWSETQNGYGWNPKNGAYYYAAFDGSIPDLNYYSTEVLGELQAIYDHWMNLGIDGFRLDGAKYLVEEGKYTENTDRTHCYLQAMRRYFNARWPESLLVGEIWADSETVATYFDDGLNELPVAFDFKTSDGIINGVSRLDATLLHAPLAAREFYNPDPAMSAPFLRNHDMDRTGSVLATVAQRKQAAIIQLSLSGTPFLYYGEEIGMSGARGNDTTDNRRRTPMQWSAEASAGFTDPGVQPWYPVNIDYDTVNVATELEDADSLLRLYQKMIRIRGEEANSALRHGAFVRVVSTPADQSYAFLRGSGEGAILVLLNMSDQALAVDIDLGTSGGWEEGIELLTETSMAGPWTGVVSVGTLSAHEARVIRLSGPVSGARR